jgi:hypothetical protein
MNTTTVWNRVIFSALFATGCGGNAEVQQQDDVSEATTTAVSTKAVRTYGSELTDDDTRALVAMLRGDHGPLLSLAQGMKIAAQERSTAWDDNGVSRTDDEPFLISSKFELNDDKTGLNLSVYTARQGRDVAPEENTLVETQGDPADAAKPWAQNATAEVFSDAEHLRRASEHLTLMRIAHASLFDVIEAAEDYYPNCLVYRVEPEVSRRGRPQFNVLLVTAADKALQVKFAFPAD